MKKRPVSVFVAVVLVLWLPVASYMYRSHGRRALHGCVAKLRADGEKVTFQELQATLSLLVDASTPALTSLVERLGPPPAGVTNFQPLLLVEPGLAHVTWKLEKPPGGDGSIEATWAVANRRVAENATAVAELRQLLQHPDANAGPRATVFETTTPFKMARTAAHWLAYATLVNLRDGQNADALANIQALAGLADLHREEHSLVSQMTRVVVAGVGLGVTWEALQAEGWTDDQLSSLQQCWERLDLFAGLERGLMGERCLGLEVLTLLRKRQQNWEEASSRASDHGSPALDGYQRAGRLFGGRIYLNTVMENDVAYHLRHLQAVVDHARLLRANRPWPDVSESWTQLNVRFESKTNSPTRYLYLLSLIGTPDFSKAGRTTARAETQRRLAVAAVALKRYELRHGQAAPNLDALTPEFLPAVPLDCMSGEPLRYRINGDGTITLYSVGEDGKDNGGDANPVQPHADPGFWNGRDAVWPLPYATAVSRETRSQ
jgi:hypothetical protein